jgi:hypothetical protein
MPDLVLLLSLFQLLLSHLPTINQSDVYSTFTALNYKPTNGHQTVDHLLYNCNRLNHQIDKLIAHISKEENWPIRKSDLVRNYLEQLICFTNSIEFEKM